MSSTVTASSMLKEERRIITNSKVNYSLIFLPHISYLLFSFLSSSDTGKNQCLCFLSMRVPQGIEICFFPLGSWADIGIMSVFTLISRSNIIVCIQ